MHGGPATVEGTHLLARAVQHETDQLDGILFIDRLDPEQRREAMPFSYTHLDVYKRQFEYSPFRK